jgi:hypothetical protein
MTYLVTSKKYKQQVGILGKGALLNSNNMADYNWLVWMISRDLEVMAFY